MISSVKESGGYFGQHEAVDARQRYNTMSFRNTFSAGEMGGGCFIQLEQMTLHLFTMTGCLNNHFIHVHHTPYEN